MRLNGSSHPKTNRYAVFGEGVDQRRRKTLMLRWRMVRQHNHATREAHIHPPRRDDQTNKSLSPVRLTYWHRSQQRIADQETTHRYQHDPAGLHYTAQESRGDGRKSARYRSWNEHGGGEKDTLSS